MDLEFDISFSATNSVTGHICGVAKVGARKVSEPVDLANRPETS
jgi:hypothetical protein